MSSILYAIDSSMLYNMSFSQSLHALSTKTEYAKLLNMGKILLNDFTNQRKYLVWLFLIAVPVTAVGYAFQEIYHCLGLILTAGSGIIFFNSFFDYPAYTQKNRQDNSNNDSLTYILRERTYVKTKYVEIITLAIVLYVLMYIAFLLDALDTGMFNDSTFLVLEHIEKIMFYPLILIFITSIPSVFLFKYEISKTGFVSLALISIIVPYGFFIMEYFFHFLEKQWTMTIVPPVILGFAFICYIISLVVISKKY